jgi:hypothetical protein
MNSNRQPKGIPSGGQFAADLRAESSLFTQEVPPMEPLTGTLGASATSSLTEAGARNIWEDTKATAARDQSVWELDVARVAMRNLAKNEATPPDVLHDMFVTPGKTGVNKVVETRLGYSDESGAMHAAIQNPSISAETLYVIAWGNGPEGSADAARQKLKERRRSSWRERFRLIGAWRRADTVRPEQLKPKN